MRQDPARSYIYVYIYIFQLLLLLLFLPGTASLQAESATPEQCKVCLENLTVQVNRLEGESQTDAVVLVENCMNFSISSMCTACTEIPVCRVSITRPNSTDTGTSTLLSK